MGSGVLIRGSFETQFCNPYDIVHGLTHRSESFGIVKYSGKTERIENKKSFLTSFFEEGIDGRGWQTESYFLNTIDSSGNKIDQELILEDWGVTEFDYCFDKENKLQFLNDSIFMTTHPEFEGRQFDFYDAYSYLDLFKVSANGEIEKLKSKRNFYFTKFIKVSRDILDGCYVRYDREEEKTYKLSQPENEVLDIMRNEIFAEYGFKFKSKKWQDYFAKKEWYEPIYENVDSMLNETEKENVQILLEMKDGVNN